MRIATWNVNGLRAALKKGLMVWLAAEQPDVLCLQETRVQPEQLDGEPWRELGYRAFWHAGSRPGYAGVATLTRLAPLAVCTGLGLDEFDAEGRVVVADYPNLRLYNVYFPSGQRDYGRVEFKLRFYAALLPLLLANQASGRPLVLCGDFNTAHTELDLARPRENRKTSGFLPEERAWVDKYLSHGLVDIFRHLHPGEGGHYTWWSTPTFARERNIGWRLDYFLLTPDLLSSVRACRIQPEVVGSDHCPVVLELS